MMEPLLAFIKSLKSNDRISSFDEAAAKQEIVLQLLSLLDWNIFNSDEVYPEYSVGGKRVDYSLRIDSVNEVFLEVKKPKEDLENHQEQLLGYCFQEGVRLAVLTNGATWWFYLPLHGGTWEQRKFYSIDVFQQETDDVVWKFLDFLSREHVKSGKAFDNAETVYKSQQKRKILEEALPKAWNMIVSEPDELLVDLINETAEKISGYKADSEMIKRFLSENEKQILSRLVHRFPITPRSTSKDSSPKLSAISGDFARKKISAFHFKGHRYEVNSWRRLLLELCRIINTEHRDDFDKVLTLSGTKRPYFTRDKDRFKRTLEIPKTDIFVQISLNANAIVKLCRRLIELFGYSDNDLKIELKVE